LATPQSAEEFAILQLTEASFLWQCGCDEVELGTVARLQPSDWNCGTPSMSVGHGIKEMNEGRPFPQRNSSIAVVI